MTEESYWQSATEDATMQDEHAFIFYEHKVMLRLVRAARNAPG